MAYDITGFGYTLKASVDLTTSQYLACIVDTNGECAIAGAGVKIDGVIQSCADIGEAVTVVQTGITKAVVGTGGATVGDELEIEAGGDFITLAGGISVGKALGTGVAGDIISVLLY